MESRRITIYSAIGPGLLLIAWIAFGDVGGANRDLLPGFIETVRTLGSLLIHGQLLADILATAQRWLIGYVLGGAAGLCVGLAIGSSRRLYDSTEFLIEFFRSLPVTAIFPLFLLLFGIGDGSKIAMVFAATVFVVILNAAYGVFHASPARRAMARSFGATPIQVFVRVTLPDALPQAAIGLRTALSLSLIVVVVAEMFIGTETGLGQRIYNSYAIDAISSMYAVILLLGVFGFVVNKSFIACERQAFRWVGK